MHTEIVSEIREMEQEIEKKLEKNKKEVQIKINKRE